MPFEKIESKECSIVNFKRVQKLAYMGSYMVTSQAWANQAICLRVTLLLFSTYTNGYLLFNAGQQD
jgi:hypothetical protein